MSSLQCREWLRKGQVFKKQPMTSTKEPEDRTRQEYEVSILCERYRALPVNGNTVLYIVEITGGQNFGEGQGDFRKDFYSIDPSASIKNQATPLTNVTSAAKSRA